MFNLICSGTTAQQGQSGGNVAVYVVLVVILIGMLILPYFSQRKKNREYEEMLNSINVGDLVKTAGGIIGRVKNITDKGEIKTVVLETGSKTEKSYLEFDMNMIYCVLKSSKPAQTDENLDDLDDEDELDEEVEVKTEENTQEEVKTEEVSETTEEAQKETPVEEEKATEEVVEKTEEKKEESKYQKKPIQKKTTKKKK